MSTETSTAGSKTVTVISYGVAILVLAAFGFLASEVLDLAKETTDEDMRWARVSQIYNSIEAIAFAAAGLLFGTVVQGKRALDAENRAEQAQENEQEAKAKGSELAVKILEIDTSERVDDEDIEEGFAPQGKQSAPNLVELQRLAKDYVRNVR